jgi:hypothetical protein
MGKHTFNASLADGKVNWVPRPQDGAFVGGDVMVFRSLEGPLVLRFKTKTPFASTTTAPFHYVSGTGDLTLTIVGPPDVYPFDCGIGTASEVVGLDSDGDQIPVSN